MTFPVRDDSHPFVFLVSSPMSDTEQRLSEQSQWLHLLLLHLTGRRLRARVEIDDLAQEVYLRVLSSPIGLPDAAAGTAALRRYLARVARTCVFDELRKLRAQKRSGREVRLARSDGSSFGLGDRDVRMKGPGPLTLAIQSEAHRNLLDAFAKLPPEYRRVIGLRQMEGLSAAETANRMLRSEAAIHSLYRRALRAWGELEQAGAVAPSSAGGDDRPRAPGRREKKSGIRDES